MFLWALLLACSYGYEKRAGKLGKDHSCHAHWTKHFTGKQRAMSYCPTVRSTTERMPLVHTEEQGEEQRQGSCLHGCDALGKHKAPDPELGSLPAYHVKGPCRFSPPCTVEACSSWGRYKMKTRFWYSCFLTWMKHVDVMMEGLNREEPGRNRSRSVRLGWYNLCPSSRSSPWKSSKCWRCWKKTRASSHLQPAPARSKAPSGDCTAACDRLKRRCSNFWRRNSWQRRGEMGAGAVTVVPERGMQDKMRSSVKRVVGKEVVFPPCRWEVIRKGMAKYFWA